jgi:hypothetical protein
MDLDVGALRCMVVNWMGWMEWPSYETSSDPWSAAVISEIDKIEL